MLLEMVAFPADIDGGMSRKRHERTLGVPSQRQDGADSRLSGPGQDGGISVRPLLGAPTGNQTFSLRPGRAETGRLEVKLIGERLDEAHWVVGADVIINRRRQKQGLIAGMALNMRHARF